jgi:glycosyltransferase involved in cell wall biosynthesis
MKQKLIVSCDPYLGDSKNRWFGQEMTGPGVRWISFDDRPVRFWERRIKRPNFATVRAALQSVLTARREKASLLFITDARLAFWCGFFSKIFPSEIPHCAFTFNFPELPAGTKRFLMSLALRRIDEFFVHSSMERKVYSDYFKIPVDRLKVRLWSIDKPDVSPPYSLQLNPYVSAIGGNGRDYKTLFDASKLIPHIPLTVVARPENLDGLGVPGHVRVLTNVPLDEAMNTLRYSEFTVLPLRNSRVPCGHVTLVCAMHLGRAVIATDSEGISDYVKHGHNGILCKANSPIDLAAAIEKLWNDSELTARLASCNAAFGAEHCTEKVARSDFSDLMIRHNLLHGTREFYRDGGCTGKADYPAV